MAGAVRIDGLEPGASPIAWNATVYCRNPDARRRCGSSPIPTLSFCARKPLSGTGNTLWSPAWRRAVRRSPQRPGIGASPGAASRCVSSARPSGREAKALSLIERGNRTAA